MIKRLGSVLVVLVLLPAGLAAQDAKAWKFDGELGASLFFGASQQTALLARNKIEWKDTRRELSLSSGFDYGMAKDGDGDNFVNKRSWVVETSADYLPGGRVSPFAFATSEGSFERQINLRTSGGAGAKYRIVDSERSRIDISLAALAERTDPRERPGVAHEVTSVGRWSGRFRVRQGLGEAAEFQLVSFYRPRMDEMRDYTWDLTTSLQYALSSTLGLRLSLVNKFDSQARDRGASSNNDGRLFFSFLASLR
jgi:hypothetical protein